jgi:hypothetical protein
MISIHLRSSWFSKDERKVFQQNQILLFVFVRARETSTISAQPLSVMKTMTLLPRRGEQE